MKKYIILFLLICMIHSASAVTVRVGYSGEGATYTCDGTRDDVQINQALDYIDGLGGGTVYLNGGHTYWIDDTLDIGAGTTLTGASTAEIKLVDDAGWTNGVPLIANIDNDDDITITNFTIDGNSGEQAVPLGDGWYPLFYFTTADNIEVSHMRLEYGCGDGLLARSSTNVRFLYNDVYKMGHDALYCIGSSYIEHAYNTIRTRTNSGCRYSDGCKHATIHDNTIYSSTTASDGSTGPAIQIGTSATASYEFDDIEIYNNKIYDIKGSGIWMSANYATDEIEAQNVYIHHNTFTNVGKYTSNNGFSTFGIAVGDFNNTIIEHNVFDDCGYAGVAWSLRDERRLQNADFYTYVRNNVFVNNAGTPSVTASGYGVMQIEANNYFILKNNCFYNNARGSTYGSRYTTTGTITSNPLFYNAATSVTAGSRDYHPRSMAGRWTGTSWTADGITSPLIDAGDTESAYNLEPAPHGYRANIGRWGNTAQASKSGSTYTLPNAYTGSALYTWAFENTTYGVVNGQTVDVRNSIKKVYVTVLGNITVSSSSMPSSGLVGWWPLKQNVSDMSGNGYHGTAHSITYSGGHAVFDGASSYVDLGKPAALDFTGSKPFTIVARYSFTGSMGTLISSGRGLMGDGDYGWAVPLSSTGNVFLDLYSTTKRSGAYTPYSGSGHIALVWDGSTNQKIYMDGILAKNYASLISSIGTTQNVKIGVDTPTNAGYFKGQIWDVAIYNRVLNATEIQDIYEGAATSSTVQLKPVGGSYVDYSPAPHVLTSGSTITGVTFSTGGTTLDGVTILEQANETITGISETEVNSYTTNISISHTPGNYTTRGTLTYVVNSTPFKNAAYRGLTLTSNNPNATVMYENETLILNTGPVNAGTAYSYVITASYSNPANEGEDLLNPAFGVLAIAVYEGGFLVQRWRDKRKKRNFGG